MQNPTWYNNQVHGSCNIAVQSCYFIIPWQHVLSCMNMAVDLSWWFHFQQRWLKPSSAFIKPWTVCSNMYEQACQQHCSAGQLNQSGVGGTVVSTRAFNLCDPGSTPAQCSYQIKIPPWNSTLEKSVSSLTLPKHRRFSPGTPVSFCTNTWLMRDGPYWTSRENSLVMTDRVIQYNKVSLVYKLFSILKIFSLQQEVDESPPCN